MGIGALVIVNLMPVKTWLTCKPGQLKTMITTLSMGRRCGPALPTVPAGAGFSQGQTKLIIKGGSSWNTKLSFSASGTGFLY
jgi:hypothetical protein